MGDKRRVAIMIGLDWPVGHHHQMFAGILRYARESNAWECVINPYADLLLGDDTNNMALDGIVARATPRLAEISAQTGIPVVNVWQNSEAKGLPCVFHDVAEAGRMAARHLVTHGFRSFAILGFANLITEKQHIQGFKEIIEPLGHACSVCLVDHQFDYSAENWRKFQKQLSEWMDNWTDPIGVMVTNDFLCRYLAEACRERHLTIPNSVALIGSGNELLIDTAAVPTLTSIDYGFEHIGYEAAALLDRLMDGNPAPAKPLLISPMSLVIRQSTDAFVVDDPMVTEALRFISEHVHQDISVEVVANHLSTTRRTLSRRFQTSLGRTIHDAITHIRLERVKRQLIETVLPLKTIAAECGFRDAIHLCKVFQRIEGTAPSEYRTARTAHMSKA